MALLPPLSNPDPTLEAADRELETRAFREPKRRYLGMSAVGHPCSRRLWYEFHQPIQERHSAPTIKRFEDGHRAEDLMASRLRMVPGIQLWTVDPDTGCQFEYTDFDGNFSGHMDGVVLGLIQAPKTPHVWEGKCVNEKKFNELRKIKAQLGEKAALEKWDYTYFCQAQAYMGYAELPRHYLTVCTPGVRDWDSVRTEFNPAVFEAIKDKARRILESKFPLAKVSNDPAWFVCRFCHYASRCHGGEA